MKHIGVAALLPAMLVAGLLVAGPGTSPAGHDGPTVQMTVTPSR